MVCSLWLMGPECNCYPDGWSLDVDTPTTALVVTDGGELLRLEWPGAPRDGAPEVVATWPIPAGEAPLFSLGAVARIAVGDQVVTIDPDTESGSPPTSTETMSSPITGLPRGGGMPVLTEEEVASIGNWSIDLDDLPGVDGSRGWIERVGSTVYTGGSGLVVALDAGTGDVIAQADFSAEPINDLTASTEGVFLGTDLGLVALELETLEERWRVSRPLPVDLVHSQAEAAYDTPIAWAERDGVVGAHQQNGVPEFVGLVEATWSTLHAGGRIVALTDTGRMYVFDPRNGDSWARNFTGAAGGVATADQVILHGHGTSLTGADLQIGTDNWTVDLGARPVHLTALGWW